MYNVMDDFRAGRQARQAADEQNYIQERRALEDPFKDRELKRTDDARAALVAKNGVEAGDPTAYGQVEGINQRRELHPTAVKQADATLEQTGVETTGMRQDNTKQLGDEARAAGLRTLALMQNSPDPTRIPPAVIAEAGTNPASYANLVKMWADAPDKDQFYKAIRGSLEGPEKVTGTISGYDSKGKPVTVKQGSFDQAGPMDNFSTVDEQKRESDEKTAQEQRSLTRAQAQRALTPPGSAGKISPQDRAAAIVRVGRLADDTLSLIAEATRNGWFPGEQQDGFTRAGAMAANNTGIVGEMWQGLMDPKAATLRSTIKTNTAALLREYVKALGITGGSINSNFELQNIQQVINNAGSSGEAQLAAMQQVKEMMADPNIAQRVIAAENGRMADLSAKGLVEDQNGNVVPYGQSGGSSVAADRRADLASRYDLGGTD